MKHYTIGLLAAASVLAAAGFPETIELRRAGSRWITSAHVQVEFDFLMSDEHQADSVDPSRAMSTAPVV